MYITHLVLVMESSVHRNTASCVLENDRMALLLAMRKVNSWVA
jgi:hypothetical protein